jgi:spore coat polysaccharide biosynthesis protein SpsF
MRPTAIVQARTSSRRLPGKMLRLVQGRPMLAYVVERLRRCRELAEVMVATSTSSDDDAIAAACGSLGVACHRGPLDDVLGRFIETIAARDLPAVVRISGDSPLIDSAIVDRAVRLFRDAASDLVTNVAPRSFPRGQSVEVISSAALRKAAAAELTPEEREHVTLWFYRHPEACAITNFAAAADMSEIQLSVDTAEDFADFAATIAAMKRPHWEYGLDELVALRRQLATRPAVSAT